MRKKSDNEKLIVYLDGRIDGLNAPDVEKELMEIVEAHGVENIILDAEGLEYISSAGLRVLMRLRKMKKAPLQVTNVSPEIYDIFDTTGFTELLSVSKRLREIDVEGYPVIGQGGNGTIYRIDEDTIVKVYKPWMDHKVVDKEREYARTAFINGIPSVIAYDVVKCGDSYGLVFEMIKSDNLGHVMTSNPERLVEYVDKYVALAKTLHSTHVSSDSFERIQDVYHRRIKNLAQWCSKEEMDFLDSIVDDIPEADTVTHNDLHPGNIMIQNDELVLIDMPEVTLGPPICDLVSVYRDMIVAPSGKEANSIERSTGMSKELILNVGNMFFMKYTGIQDPEELKAYYQKLGLLFAFNVVLVCGSGSEKAMELAPMFMDKLLRGVVIPNEQTIRMLFKVM